jgi:hypothetical protein
MSAGSGWPRTKSAKIGKKARREVLLRKQMERFRVKNRGGWPEILEIRLSRSVRPFSGEKSAQLAYLAAVVAWTRCKLIAFPQTLLGYCKLALLRSFDTPPSLGLFSPAKRKLRGFFFVFPVLGEHLGSTTYAPR